jgi:hypothetical protein
MEGVRRRFVSHWQEDNDAAAEAERKASYVESAGLPRNPTGLTPALARMRAKARSTIQPRARRSASAG